MVEITSYPLSSTWKNTSSAKWRSASGTWKVNGYRNGFAISVMEDISLSVTRNSKVDITKADHVYLDTHCSDSINRIVNIDEDVGMSDSLNKEIQKTLNTMFAVVQMLSCKFGNSVLLNTAEGLHLGERVKKKVGNYSCKENIEINGCARLALELSKEEQFAISDSAYVSKLLMFYEQLKLMEYMSNHNILSMELNESLSITDSRYYSIGKHLADRFQIDDILMKNCNAVISDIIISDNKIVSDVPAGYGEWLPFVSGDYTYEEALIKCVLTLLSTDYSALLTDYKVFVDLPDLQDHAVTSVPAEKYYIPFSLGFYRVPEVTITTIGSSEVAIPHIVEVTVKGFYVELRNLSNELTAGRISWQALGC